MQRQCGTSSASGFGNNLTLNLTITFTSSFAGRPIWMNASDNGGLTSGWQIPGSWSVTTVEPINPSITSLNPSSGPVGTLVTITGTNFGTVRGKHSDLQRDSGHANELE